MKRWIITLSALLTSLLSYAQEPMDFFKFVNSIDWKMPEEEFVKKNKDIILDTQKDEKVGSTGYFLDGIAADGHPMNFVYVYNPTASRYPLIMATIPYEVTEEIAESTDYIFADNMLSYIKKNLYDTSGIVEEASEDIFKAYDFLEGYSKGKVIYGTLQCGALCTSLVTISDDGKEGLYLFLAIQMDGIYSNPLELPGGMVMGEQYSDLDLLSTFTQLYDCSPDEVCQMVFKQPIDNSYQIICIHNKKYDFMDMNWEGLLLTTNKGRLEDIICFHSTSHEDFELFKDKIIEKKGQPTTKAENGKNEYIWLGTAEKINISYDKDAIYLNVSMVDTSGVPAEGYEMDRIQDKFFGIIKLGQPFDKSVFYKICDNFDPSIDYKATRLNNKAMGYTLFRKMYFAGEEWDAISFRTFEGRLIEITFKKLEDKYNAQRDFEGWKRKMIRKYGFYSTSGQLEGFCCWSNHDATNSASIAAQKTDDGLHYIFSLSYYSAELNDYMESINNEY